MIKYNAKTRSGRLFGFVLTAENITKLQAGNPIHINLAQVDGPADIELLISYETTDSAAMNALEKFIGPATELRTERTQ